MGDDADEETSATFLQQIFDLWVEPEFQRRLQAFNPADVSKVLVIMPPGRSVEVRLNDEAVLVANVRVTRAIDAGETVTTDDVDEMHDLRPHEVDPDAGWVCFARVGQQVVISFDFRRNRRRARERLDLARGFLATAQLAYDSRLYAPAIENLFAAMELTVVAAMMQIIDEPPQDHTERRRWFRAWSELGNAPIDHSRALARLAKERRSARYGDRRVTMKPPEIERLLGLVDETIKHVEATVADREPRRSA